MITWFTDTVGTAAYAGLDAETLASGSVVDVRVLVDRAGNHPQDILRFIDKAQQVHARTGKAVIACDMGISRSRVIALGLLTRLGRSFDDGLALILRVAENPDINLPLLRTLATALEIDDPVRSGNAGACLLLGGAGFMGRNLKQMWEGEYEVRAPGRDEIDLLDGPIPIARYLDRHSCASLVYACHPKSHHSARSFAESLQMLKNALDAVRGADCHLVFISTLQVFSGNAREAIPERFEAADDATPVPYANYAEAKLFGERLVELQAQQHALRATILRPSGLYGPGMAKAWLIPKLIEAAIHDEPITTHRYRNGLPELELLHIDDLGRAVHAVISANDTPRILHVGSGQPLTTQDAAEKIIQLGDSRSRCHLLDIADDVGRLVSRPSSWLGAQGWQPRIALDRGLEDLIQRERKAS